MADESMVRGLAAQAEAIWPQEREMLLEYRESTQRSPGARVLDLACGTGEISSRLLGLFPECSLVGIDLESSHIDRARARCREFGDRARFEVGSAYQVPCRDSTFDLAVCRHLFQAIPEPDRVVAEMVRVTRPGGRLHMVVEDYGMIYFHPTRTDTERFWREGPFAFGRATGTDLAVGRKMFGVLQGLGLARIAVRYIAVDTLRVARETFARIWEAWRDGYSDAIASRTALSGSEVRAAWDDMLACLADPAGYALWHVPVWTAIKT